MKIRTRLTIQFILTMAGILGAFGVAILLFISLNLDKGIEVAMHESAIAITSHISQRPGGLYTSSQQELDTLAPPDMAVQVQDQSGKVLASSTSWKEQNLPASLLRNVFATDQAQRVTRGKIDIYLYRHAVFVGARLQGYVLVVHSAEISALALRLLIGFLIPGVIVDVGIAGLLVWLLVRRATRPLERLAATASEIAAVSDHSLRLQAEGPPDEITRLAHTINGMLQSLEDAYQQVQEVNDLQRQFLADVSHELRTPLTIMLSSLDLVKKEGGTDPDFQVSALENMRVEAERMARMVTQLLLLARTDASATVIREPLLVADVVTDVVADISGQEQQAGSKIRVEYRGLAQPEDAVVAGNADYLKQLFLILLENAFKYTPDGGRVEVSSTLKGDRVTITVADTGIGIAEADLPKVFDRFYRAENARFRSGLGLGLSIAQGIAEQHGGTITVDSTPGRGSRFIVTLPLLIQVDTPESFSAGEPLAGAPKT